MGYIGSSTLLILCLIFIQGIAPQFNIQAGLATRYCFVAVGIWWVGFAQIFFSRIKSHTRKVSNPNENSIFKGFHELKKVWKQVKQNASLLIYLRSFWFFSMGVQTVMYIGTIFGSNELKLPDNALIVTILLLQLLAIVGAYCAAVLSGKWGNTKTISAILFIWIGVCVSAYFVYTEVQFYGLAAGIGFVMGGVQSLSRSTYAKFLPENTPDTASYFSFYDACDKFSTFLGTIIFGVITQLSGMRNSLLFLALIFVIGLLILRRIPSQKIYRTPLSA
jgi:UMF1 family MFS transporter